MARYSGGALTGAGSTTLPVIALYAGATGSPRLSGLRVWSTTTTTTAFELVRVTTAGTWTSLTEAPFRDRASANVGQLFHTASGTAPTIGTRFGIFYQLGAAIGSGVMDVFDDPITIPTGTGNGVALVPVANAAAVYATFIFEDD